MPIFAQDFLGWAFGFKRTAEFTNARQRFPRRRVKNCLTPSLAFWWMSAAKCTSCQKRVKTIFRHYLLTLCIHLQPYAKPCHSVSKIMRVKKCWYAAKCQNRIKRYVQFGCRGTTHSLKNISKNIAFDSMNSFMQDWSFKIWHCCPKTWYMSAAKCE